MSILSELKFLVGKEKHYTTKILEKFIYLINSRAFVELVAHVFLLKVKSARKADKINRNQTFKKIEHYKETLKLLKEINYDLNTWDKNEIIHKLCKFYKNKPKSRETDGTHAVKVDKKQLTFSSYIESQVKEEVLKKSGHL